MGKIPSKVDPLERGSTVFVPLYVLLGESIFRTNIANGFPVDLGPKVICMCKIKKYDMNKKKMYWKEYRLLWALVLTVLVDAFIFVFIVALAVSCSHLYCYHLAQKYRLTFMAYLWLNYSKNYTKISDLWKKQEKIFKMPPSRAQ